MSEIRQQFETVLAQLPKSKIRQLLENLEKNQLNSASSIYEFQNKLGISSEQVKLLKKVLKLIPDSSSSIVFELLDELRKLKQDHVESTQLVMTNPLVDEKLTPTRGTMLEMINQAKSHIILVGYAIYGDVKPIFDAMATKKEQDGVTIDLLFNNGRKNLNLIKENWNPKVSLPNVYSYHPKQKRSSLHAKVLIIDNDLMLVTSANMTENAMEKNVEMGLVHKGKIVTDAKMLFQSLIDEGYMVKLT